MKAFLKSTCYIFLSNCVASTLSSTPSNYLVIAYFSLLFFACYELVQSLNKEVTHYE